MDHPVAGGLRADGPFRALKPSPQVAERIGPKTLEVVYKLHRPGLYKLVPNHEGVVLGRDFCKRRYAAELNARSIE